MGSEMAGACCQPTAANAKLGRHCIDPLSMHCLRAVHRYGMCVRDNFPDPLLRGQVLSDMRADGCAPNTVTFNSLIAACAQGECRTGCRTSPAFMHLSCRGIHSPVMLAN